MERTFLGDVVKIHAVLKDILEPTPLQYSQYLSDRYGANIWLKREDLTPVRSYKVRGAYAFIQATLDQDPDQEAFVCSSAGNHAQGFAYACRHFRKKGVVFMPLTTPQQKIMKTRSFGVPFVDIELVGDSFDEANRAAIQFAKDNNAFMVPPFDHPLIIRGQATVAKEILEQAPKNVAFDRVIMPVGGGGLSAGITKYFEEIGVSADFSFVEPEDAPSLYQSLLQNEHVTLNKIDNFVDGAAVARIGAQNYAQLSKFSSDDVMLIPTGSICTTMLDMLNIEGVVLEPAGALAIDALNHLPKEALEGKNIVCIASGGNFDFERLPEVKERALKYSELKKYYVIQFPQRPGALREFLSMLGPDDDIARFEYLKKSARNFGSVLIGIESTTADSFKNLAQRFDEAGLRYVDITDDETIASFIV